MGKRKRKSCDAGLAVSGKRLKLACTQSRASESRLSPLQHYYPQVLTLRRYLVAKLPAASTARRRILHGEAPAFRKGTRRQPVESDTLRQLLDSALVGCSHASRLCGQYVNGKDFQQYSQQLTASTTSTGPEKNASTQSEVVDFAIWLLFNKVHPNTYKPPHILCHGIQRAAATWQNGHGVSVACRIPGLTSTFPNEHIETLKSPVWSELLALMGRSGTALMLDLIIECAIFLPVPKGLNNLYQLSGVPMHDVKLPISNPAPAMDNQLHVGRVLAPPSKALSRSESRRLADIRFVRHRMFYARPALNAKGEVLFGLRHIHVLNRCRNVASPEHWVHIMKYLFPRQFGLHNVFTSNPDPRETTQSFQDYTLREHEIAKSSYVSRPNELSDDVHLNPCPSLPKRLRGAVCALVQRLQRLHRRCSYSKLLNHYCPPQPQESNDGSLPASLEQSQCLPELATPPEHVSAFVRAAVSRVIPLGFFGDGDVGEQNRKLILRNVDTFIKARRFESLTLEKVTQGLKVQGVSWLRPPKLTETQKMSLSDLKKRKELFCELVYYIFDSFVIPLVRSNFHVTESNMNKNQLFYFRHDTWRKLTEPALVSLKRSMFVEMSTDETSKIFGRRVLGPSQIRLLPKAKGMRPIANLRRRVQTQRNGSKILGRSINSMLAPVSSVIKYEKRHQPGKLGSSLFSVGDIYLKIRAFRTTLLAQGFENQPLFFAKVDVQSCFDSLPQDRVLEVVKNLLSADEYGIARHAEIKMSAHRDDATCGRAPTKKFRTTGIVLGEFEAFDKFLHQLSYNKQQNTVFVDGVVQKQFTKQSSLDLLQEHIQCNIVKFGKKFYRQKQGIPQGSVLSSLLCNLLYAEFEREHLAFLSGRDSLLLRLVDDFLLVTTSHAQATLFLETMSQGSPAYGITIKPAKSMTNFPAVLSGISVPCLDPHLASAFPYCGLAINTNTLDISKDRNTSAHLGRVSDSLTVEYSKNPGQAFRRKMRNAVKLQMLTMLFDTSYNAKATVLASLHNVYLETANKCLNYIKCLRGHKLPGVNMVIEIVHDTIELSFALMKSRRNSARCSEYKCSITKAVAQWLACSAFLHVFGPKQTRYSQLQKWLVATKRASTPWSVVERGMLVKLDAHVGNL